MKKTSILSILALSITILTTSCEDLLEEYNPSGLTAEAVYTTPEGFESLVNAAYSYQRWWYGKEEAYNMTEMGTDIWMSAAGDVWPDLSTYTNLQGTNAPITTLWTQLYAAVNLTNAGINRIADAGLTPANRLQREAELRFLRAFYYYHIVETWGGVHFTLEESQGIITTANKTPVDTFYAQILEDLNFAVKHLAPTTPDYGRVTKPAAMSFLARIYLTRKMYKEASDMATAVINGGFGYKLVPNYKDLWNMANNRNSEIVYAVNYAENLTLNDLRNNETNPLGHGRGSNNGHLHFLMKYDNLPGLTRAIEYGRPFNRYMPTRTLLDLYSEADNRYEGSFMEVWYANSTNLPAGMHRGDTAVVATRSTFKGSAGHIYQVYNRNDIYNQDGTVRDNLRYPTLTKHMDNTRSSANEAQSARDAYVIRFAELYLIAAEAQMYLGNLQAAADFINVVRARAAKPGQADAMKITADQVTIDFILDERAREFAGEQLRWFDLKRTNKLVDRVPALNPDVKSVGQHHYIRPIPQSQLDAVTNRDEFTQNPGYQ
ncbi:RagB/SusD family nutrient uptake outer membrane protein [Algoriphagus sp. H41]|uniref:RagB/SusD family nutrient uptake outer membrane protein n=1 Tax=Algoriphagus oliviformis TaxID=2811231 RepID=A0ABS3C5D1_9BACT|nr:RagB/SusD family nutrient uptake outer membrane protein [Algoriphagus oliviformis]MBN7810789.1 RagB/SusD family nutrient uptake outer membrane protein [Algoriphagus oliviformis]